MSYFTQTDLENALSVPVVKAVYDDDHDGTVDAAAMTACIEYGTAMCNSFLRGVYRTSASGGAIELPLTTVPDEVRFAALDFGIAYSMRRRPDVVKAMNEKDWTAFRDSAIEQMKRYCESAQRLPTTTGVPATVGGQNFAPDPTDDDPPDRRWDVMGDFS